MGFSQKKSKWVVTKMFKFLCKRNTKPTRARGTTAYSVPMLVGAVIDHIEEVEMSNAKTIKSLLAKYCERPLSDSFAARVSKAARKALAVDPHEDVANLPVILAAMAEKGFETKLFTTKGASVRPALVAVAREAHKKKTMR